MPEAFSFNREYDYIRPEGLSRATGRPAHEWDIYIIKELIDNALDADESLWRDDPGQYPSLSIHIQYIPVKIQSRQQLIVHVENRQLFPVEGLRDIFATQFYLSRKALVKGVTRGALGNALKTLLGIPYALRTRFADDGLPPQLKPLSIYCGETEYCLRYVLNSLAQTIHLEYEIAPCKPVSGTKISVRSDYFVQEVPRTLADIEELSQQYYLCNPHAQFHWVVEMEGTRLEKIYLPQRNWTAKFNGTAPARWYSLTAFSELLAALYRSRVGSQPVHHLPVSSVCSYFFGLNSPAANAPRITRIMQEIGKNSLTKEDLDSPLVKTLFTAMCKYSPSFHSSQLGCIGREHVTARLTEAFPIDGKIQYAMVTDAESDPAIPFIIEVAVARLQEGKKRQIWTSLNFSPTYGDPFLSRWFHPLKQPEESALGLRGLLDFYGIGDDAPFLLFLHLICPNIEHNEFSKTEINHLPFRKSLVEIFDKVIEGLRQEQVAEEMRLEQAISQALNNLLENMAQDEKLIPEQLLEALLWQLRQNPALRDWLEKPENMYRLTSYIESYQNRNPEIKLFIAYQPEIVLHVPLHPRHYCSLPVEYISRNLLEKYAVNKILYVQSRGLEPVVLANNWLCRMDMALLQASPDTPISKEVLLQCIAQSEVPVFVLHDGEESDYDSVESIQTWLKQQEQGKRRYVLIDLQPIRGSGAALKPKKIMPGKLEKWLLDRIAQSGIAIKYRPSPSRVRQDIHACFDQLLQNHLFEEVDREISLKALVTELDTAFSTEMMRDVQLDKKIEEKQQQKMKLKSYQEVLDTVVKEFFVDFLEKHASQVQELVKARLS